MQEYKYNVIIQGVAKKKDILNIHIRSDGINIFSKKWLHRVYHICGQMSKILKPTTTISTVCTTCIFNLLNQFIESTC